MNKRNSLGIEPKVMDYQQRFEGALSFENEDDLRLGIKAGQDFLNSRGNALDLQNFIVTQEVYTPTGLEEETFFRVEQNMLAPASSFHDMTIALGYIAVYAASGTIECLLDVDGRVERRLIGGKEK